MANTSTPPPPVSAGPIESRSEQVVAICLSMLALSTVVVLARIWIRLTMVTGRLGLDDWAILVSWAFSIAFIVDVVSQTKYGLGKHIYDLPPTTNFTESLKLFYFGEAIYYIVVGTTKIAILILYLRFAITRGYRALIWTTTAVVVATFLAFAITGLFQCSPINYAWDKTIPNGTCFNVTTLFYANAGVNIFQDVFIYILPMKLFWEMQVPRKQKIALVVVFAVGGFVCITGMIRLNSLKVASISKDPTWDNFDSAIWSAIESHTGLVCASLPHFKPLIARYMPSAMGIRSTSTMTPLGDQPISGRSHNLKSSNLDEVEMGHGNGKWESGKSDSFDRPGYNVAIMGKSRSCDNSSEEALTDVAQSRGEGIYKDTSVSVSYV